MQLLGNVFHFWKIPSKPAAMRSTSAVVCGGGSISKSINYISFPNGSACLLEDQDSGYEGSGADLVESAAAASTGQPHSSKVKSADQKTPLGQDCGCFGKSKTKNLNIQRSEVL